MIYPEIKQVDKIDFIRPEKTILPNGIPLYVMDALSEDVSRIDFIFEAGVWNQSRPLVAFFTNQMLREGSKKMSGFEIAEKLDFYGAWLQLSNAYHYSYITLYSLNKYLSETLIILEQVVKYPVFPQDDFKTIVNNRKQQFLVDSEKVNVLASRHFQNLLYGNEHPYGKITSINDYDTLNIDDIKSFYEKHYHSANCKIVISGNVSNNTIQQTKNIFGSDKWGSQEKVISLDFTAQPGAEKQLFIPKKDAVQSSVVIGRPFVTFNHPDYHALQVLNTALGGYFGSRLMSNIREEKGYTYGISSYISALLKGGRLTIASQTGTEYTQLLINEVYKELDKLCHETMSDEELETVKNYMLGDNIRSFDGVFSQADALISLLTRKIDYSFYEKNIETIKNITPQTIQELAKRYFIKDEFYQVICGQQS